MDDNMSVDSTTLAQIHDDLEAILENYIYELNNGKTHQLIAQNISAYFSAAWPDYPVTHLSVDAISEHGVGIALQVGDVPITGYIDDDYRVDGFNVDFSLAPDLEEELLRAVSQDITVEIDPALLRPRTPTVEDILFSTVKNT